MDGVQLPTTLKACLKDIGFEAELELPDPSTYTYCCGFFTNFHARTYQARLTTLLLINWLNTLGRSDASENVLKGALILAEKFLKLHRDAMGEIILFKEIEQAKEHYDVKDLPEYFDVLQEYSEGVGHRDYPKIIKKYLKAHPEHQEILTIKKYHHSFWSHFICCGGGEQDIEEEDVNTQAAIKKNNKSIIKFQI